MSVVTALLGVIGGLFGLLFFFKGKKDSAEALLQNQATKEQLTKIDGSIAKNDGLEAAEEEKRKQLEQDAAKEKAKDVTKDELLNFLNNPNKQ